MSLKIKHVLFWIVYTLFIYMIYSVLTEIREALFRTIGMVSMQLIAYLINTKFLLPTFYKQKKYARYTFFNFILLLVSVFLIDYLIRLSYYIEHLDRDHRYTLDTVFNYKYFSIDNLEIIFNHMMPILLSVFLSFLFYNFLQQKKREEQEVLHIKAEKDFLISQINPHFLFNTLNNIYSLTLSNDDKGSKAVMQLSKMLDYSLYSSNEETVRLKEEIDYIINFIALFKLKDDKINTVDFRYNNANNELRISPMILIPFIENAFKHGNIEDVKNGYISIILESKNDTILFSCENSYQSKKSVDPSSGIGISNVKRRLAILYPNQHHLNIQQSSAVYKVSLSVDIE